ncbi:MAG: LON peptidase substrate-binding domain-containing protein [Candidatus Rokubacteria bacterium]|nr:LON peptidase substrate-binding domain-containing protein [Candidatus Rokubacteria bacterium]
MVLPLHVFEARYRAMVTDALARDRRLCVVKLEPGWEDDYEGKPAVAAVAGAGEIVNAERLPSGRYNILVRGDWRVRVERELPTDTLYRVVVARRLEETGPAGDASATVTRVRAACGRLLETLGKSPDLLDTVLAADQAAGVIADRVAAALITDAALRQALLETLDVGRRLERLAVVLERFVQHLRGKRQ